MLSNQEHILLRILLRAGIIQFVLLAVGIIVTRQSMPQVGALAACLFGWIPSLAFGIVFWKRRWVCVLVPALIMAWFILNPFNGWLFFLLILGLPLITLLATKPVMPPPPWQCKCGYDLRGLPAGVCPECGREPAKGQSRYELRLLSLLRL